MQAPYRIAAPPVPDAPDPVDDYELLLRTRAARGRRAMTAACGLVAAASVLAFAEVPPISRAPSDTAEMRAAARISAARAEVAAAKDAVLAEQARFATAVAAALADPAGEDASPAPCDVVLPEASHLVHGRQAFPLVVVAVGDRDLPSPSVAAVLADVYRAEEHLDNGRYGEGILYAHALGGAGVLRSRLRHDVVLVTRVRQHPLRTSGTSFEAGRVAGRAYLYDFAQHRVTCAGDVSAASSRTIAYSFVSAEGAPAALDQGPSLTASLDLDLEVQTQRAIAAGALRRLELRR